MDSVFSEIPPTKFFLIVYVATSREGSMVSVNLLAASFREPFGSHCEKIFSALTFSVFSFQLTRLKLARPETGQH